MEASFRESGKRLLLMISVIRDSSAPIYASAAMMAAQPQPPRGANMTRRAGLPH